MSGQCYLRFGVETSGGGDHMKPPTSSLLNALVGRGSTQSVSDLFKLSDSLRPQTSPCPTPDLKHPAVPEEWLDSPRGMGIGDVKRCVLFAFLCLAYWLFVGNMGIHHIGIIGIVFAYSLLRTSKFWGDKDYQHVATSAFS